LVIKPLEEDHTPGTVKPVPVSLVEPVAYQFQLFRTLLDAGVVDTVEPAIIPVLLGGGVPLLPATATRTQLTLIRHRLYNQSGIMLLEYAVRNSREVDSP
jgi:hypothetical protein